MTKPSDHQSNLDIVRNRPHYFKMIKELMERRKLQANSIHFSKQLMKDRRKAMYQNEYDRIKGIIAHSVLPQQTREIYRR